MDIATFQKTYTSLLGHLIKLSKSLDIDSTGNEDVKSARTTQIELFKDAFETLEKVDETNLSFKTTVSQIKKLRDAHLSSVIHGRISWIKSGAKISILLPKTSSAKFKKLKPVDIGTLYSESLALCEKTELALDTAEVNDEINEKYTNSVELVFPDILKLYIWRLFLLVTDVSEDSVYDALKEEITLLERRLGISNGGDIIRDFLRQLSLPSGVLSNLVTNVSPLLAQMGVEPTKVMDAIREVANGKSDSDTATAISNAIDMLGAKDSSGAIKDLIKDFFGEDTQMDESTMDQIKLIFKFAKKRASGEKKSPYIKGLMKRLEDVRWDDPSQLVLKLGAEFENKELDKEMRLAIQTGVASSKKISSDEKSTKAEQLYETYKRAKALAKRILELKNQLMEKKTKGESINLLSITDSEAVDLDEIEV